MYKYFVEEWKVTDEYCEGKIRYRLDEENGNVEVLTMKDAIDNVFIAPRSHWWVRASNRIHDLDLGEDVSSGEEIPEIILEILPKKHRQPVVSNTFSNFPSKRKDEANAP